MERQFKTPLAAVQYLRTVLEDKQRLIEAGFAGKVDWSLEEVKHGLIVIKQILQYLQDHESSVLDRKAYRGWEFNQKLIDRWLEKLRVAALFRVALESDLKPLEKARATKEYIEVRDELAETLVDFLSAHTELK